MKTVDAKGKNCPIPVIMAKTEIDNGNEEFVVEVDKTWRSWLAARAIRLL